MTTTFFNPTEAPRVHLELLPSNAVTYTVDYGPYVPPHGAEAPHCLSISVFAPRLSGLTCAAGGNLDDFVEETCYDCKFYVEEIEVDLSYSDYEYEDSEYGTLYLHGTAYAGSPCPCYNDGIGEVEFPCSDGHEMPQGEDLNTELSGQYMNYMISHNLDYYGKPSPSAIALTCAWQQAHIFKDDLVWISDSKRAINTYQDNRVCWGDSTHSSPKSLHAMELAYTCSRANEDLCDFDFVHSETGEIEVDVNDWIEADDPDEKEHYLGIGHDITPITPGGELAVVAVTSKLFTEAFVLLASSGCSITSKVAHVLVRKYRDVAIDDDTVLDVWASDVLDTGVRLLFLQGDTSVYLGQVPSTFSLEPCKSIKQQSSELGAQDKVSCPA